MPYIEINLEQFYYSLGEDEKEELLALLKEDGLPVGIPNTSQHSDSESSFDYALIKLIGRKSMLTNEEEAAIIKMAQRFI